MRTTLDIPADLLEAARRASNARNKREAVIAGLQELIRKSHREELRRMAGRLDIAVGLRRSRRRTPA